MASKLQTLLADLDTHRATLRAAVDSVPPGLRERRPAPDRWSVAEILEHLAIVETRIAGLLTARVSAMKAAGVADGSGPKAAPVAVSAPRSTSFSPSGLVDRTSRVKTGASSEPKGGIDATAAWALLERSRSTLRDLLITSDGLALHEITHPHPFFGPLNAYEWVEFLGGHDARHAAQIREAGDGLAHQAGT
jgi:hypothetical protein